MRKYDEALTSAEKAMSRLEEVQRGQDDRMKMMEAATLESGDTAYSMRRHGDSHLIHLHERVTDRHHLLGWAQVFTGGFPLAHFVHLRDVCVGVNVEWLLTCSHCCKLFLRLESCRELSWVRVYALQIRCSYLQAGGSVGLQTKRYVPGDMSKHNLRQRQE